MDFRGILEAEFPHHHAQPGAPDKKPILVQGLPAHRVKLILG